MILEQARDSWSLQEGQGFPAPQFFEGGGNSAGFRVPVTRSYAPWRAASLLPARLSPLAGQ
jgi:hypothetical protein